MSGKVLRILLIVPLLLTGCAVFAPKPTVPSMTSKETAVQGIRSSATTIKAPPRRTEAGARNASVRPKPPAAPTGGTTTSGAATATIISKEGAKTSPPVPLFRQAIVLANVRAAVADLPSPPHAEFRQGLLTLKFREASPEQISTAVNRAMTVPEVTRVRTVIGG